jgi:hypothetical protein
MKYTIQQNCYALKFDEKIEFTKYLNYQFNKIVML